MNVVYEKYGYQVSIYRIQLHTKHQGPNETLGEFRDTVERVVRLAYQNARDDVADDLGHNRIVASLQDKELWEFVHQACPQKPAEAQAAALQGKECFRAEEDKAVVQAVALKLEEPVRSGLSIDVPTSLA